MSRAIGLLILCMALVACCPAHTNVRTPGPVEYRDKLVQLPVPEELTAEHDVANGPLSQCPQVAAARKAELQACNADKRAIRELGEGR